MNFDSFEGAILSDVAPTIEKLLVNYIKLSNISKGNGALVYVMLPTQEQKLNMCRYLDENPEATESEILGMAERIARYNLYASTDWR
jgi:hypothetical protein